MGLDGQLALPTTLSMSTASPPLVPCPKFRCVGVCGGLQWQAGTPHLLSWSTSSSHRLAPPQGCTAPWGKANGLPCHQPGIHAVPVVCPGCNNIYACRISPGSYLGSGKIHFCATFPAVEGEVRDLRVCSSSRWARGKGRSGHGRRERCPALPPMGSRVRLRGML